MRGTGPFVAFKGLGGCADPRIVGRSRLKVIGVLCAIAAFAAFFKYSTDHPTSQSIQAHVLRDAASHRVAKLNDAEARTLRDLGRRRRLLEGKPHWETLRTEGAARRTLVHHGRIGLRMGYDDGYFFLSDVHHWVSGRDGDPIKALFAQHTVAAGGPGLVMIGACCEGNEAPVALSFLRRAPERVGKGWSETTDADLDLPTGRLAFTTTGGTGAVVAMPSGRYRVRVSGMGAFEGQQERERFRIDLWPRTANAPIRVIDPADRP